VLSLHFKGSAPEPAQVRHGKGRAAVCATASFAGAADASGIQMERVRSLRPRSCEDAPSWFLSGWFGMLGWAAAVLLLAFACQLVRSTQRALKGMIASAEHAALVTEVFDQHVATLAANLPPQVISTDRHTVKPWFQGKIPFSFNLPEGLPSDTTLDGANLTYLQPARRPTALQHWQASRLCLCPPKSGKAEANFRRQNVRDFM
jgi:anti-sigma factor RsiW